MDVAVVGGGVFGLAAAIELRSRDHRVVLFEQGTIPNTRAASTNVSKTLRRHYGNQEVYVELAERAALGWEAWQRKLGTIFVYRVGHLTIARHFVPGSELAEGWNVLTGRGADLRMLSAADARARFPQFALHDDDVCIFDPWAGYVASGEAIVGMAALARAAGVHMLEESPVARIDETPSLVSVVSSASESPMRFDRAVVAAGVWMGRLVQEVAAWITITRQHEAIFRPDDPSLFAPGVLPVWSAIDVSEDGWYGHPLAVERAVKVANHARGPVVDPDVERTAAEDFVLMARRFLAERIPVLAHAPLLRAWSCLYDNTPDLDFIVDWKPGSSRVLIAGGGSGHGFKFGGSIGPVIADALEDKPNSLGDRFRLRGRFGMAAA